MRKLLLGTAATAAALAGAAGAASAQTTLPPTYSEGVPSKPQPVQGANNSNNYQPAFLPGGVANPVPGSIVVRLNGRVLAYGFDAGSSFDRTAGTGATNAGAAKIQQHGILGFLRLYAGVDGLAANGLKYGASIEIRTNSDGALAGSTANSGSSGSTTRETLFARREFVYFGTETAGIFRVGQADGVTGIFDNGVTTFQNFDDGGWNGDLPDVTVGNASPTFPFLSQQGAEYGSSKVVYLSPQFAGFDFGVQYAPSNSSIQNGNVAIASTGAENLASSSTALDGARYKNQYTAGVRYQNKFGDLAVYGYGAYVGSGHVNYTGTAAGQQFNGLSVGDFGAAVTYAGFTIGGHYMVGDINGAEALQPKGGIQGEVWLGGVQYAAGPLTIGASYYDYTSQGSPSLVKISQRHEKAAAAGLTYGIAPGFSLFTSYLYGTRHQGDFNFASGAVGTANNNVQAQAVAVGTIVKW